MVLEPPIRQSAKKDMRQHPVNNSDTVSAITDIVLMTIRPTCPYNTLYKLMRLESAIRQSCLVHDSTPPDDRLTNDRLLQTEQLDDNSKDIGRTRWPTARHAKGILLIEYIRMSVQ